MIEPPGPGRRSGPPQTCIRSEQNHPFGECRNGRRAAAQLSDAKLGQSRSVVACMIRVLVLTVALGVLISAPAPSKPMRIGGWERVAGAERLLLSDGARYVVTRSAGGVMRVYDTATGKRRTLRSPVCDSGRALPVALGAAGGGGLVWDCASVAALGGHTFYGENLTTGLQFVPTGMAALRKLESQSADASRFRARLVGRRWIYAIRSGYRYADDALVSVRTARVIHNPASAAGVTVAPETDAGVQRLCPGIRRSPGNVELGRLPFGPLLFEEPFALSQTQSVALVRTCDDAPAAIPQGRVVASVGSGRLAWLQGREVRILRSTASGVARRRAPGRVRRLALTRGFVYARTTAGVFRASLTL